MLFTIPILVLLGIVTASNDPPPGNWWSADCYTKDIFWMEEIKGEPVPKFKTPGKHDFSYDWMLTSIVCNAEYYPQAHYNNGRCVAFEPGFSINGRNWWASCADYAKKGFNQIQDGTTDYSRKYYGIGEGRGYLPGQ
ncbi:hypothetical protein Ptr902_02743 [Pyrenophora tritici-repentis]|nr:hypothetical protein Ptr902_02743 [Pyrenophora tritici-repentis]